MNTASLRFRTDAPAAVNGVIDPGSQPATSASHRQETAKRKATVMKPLVVLLVAAALPGWAVAQTASAPSTTTTANRTATGPSGGDRPTIRINLDQKPTAAPGAKAPAATSTTKATGSTAAKAVPGAKEAAKGTADKTTKKDAKGAKKEEPPPKVDGQEIGRSTKGFLGLRVADGVFKLGFYDEKKKPIAPDVVRAALRFQPTYQRAPEIYILDAGDGKTLTVAKPVRPPYNFKLFISLFKDGVDEPTESYVVDFRQ